MDSLLCEEELLTSPSRRDHDLQTPGPFFSTKEDRENAFKVCLQKEPSFMVESGYLQHIKNSLLLQARFKAVRWMIKTRRRLNLSFGTIFDSVNYFDRFISKNRCKIWEYWVIELLSIACLSIAAKSNEVRIPTLLEIQGEGLEYFFEGSTIRRMELTILKALSWRLKCETAYSIVELLIGCLDGLNPHLQAALIACVTELLLVTLSDPKFLEFRSSSIAVSAFRCAVDEFLPLKSHAYVSDLTHLMPNDQLGEIQRCHNCMEKRMVDPLYRLMSSDLSHCSPSSPLTVMEEERLELLHYPVDLSGIEILDSCIDLNFSLFKVAGNGFSLNSKKRKREGVVT